MRKSILTLLLLIVMPPFSPVTKAQAETAIAIEGLDPLMLIQGKEAQGDLKISVTRGRFQYLFANPENKALFEKEPERYEIQLGGSCARMGPPVRGNPDLYTVYRERIYIFGSTNCMKVFKEAPEKFVKPASGAAGPPPDSGALKESGAPVEKAAAASVVAGKSESLSGEASPSPSADWSQWGGPHRNFKSDVKGLPPAWPESGPRRLWSRELGEGYSAIVAAGGKLYTMYRKGEQDVVICMEAGTGRTVWEFAYAAPFSKDYDMANGPGPHATPLVSGDKVFAVGATGKLHCLNRESGKLLWAHDLMGEFKGNLRVNGYSCSPIAYRNTVIMMVGGPGASVIAFNQADGSVAWKKHDFRNSTCSPLIINVAGQDQLVAFMFGEIVGLDPATGDLLWTHPHATDYGLNTSTPVWGDDNLLFVSSGYNGGSRVIRLVREGGRTRVEEVWANRLMRVHFGTAIRVGDYVYGSSGDFGPAPLTAVNVKSGQVAWRDRSLARASFIYADGRFILLDEDGHLALATPTPEGLKVQSKVELLANNSWTVPTLSGTRLYARDRKTVLALDLK